MAAESQGNRQEDPDIGGAEDHPFHPNIARDCLQQTAAIHPLGRT
jgi:hypothetical protein